MNDLTKVEEFFSEFDKKLKVHSKDIFNLIDIVAVNEEQAVASKKLVNRIFKTAFDFSTSAMLVYLAENKDMKIEDIENKMYYCDYLYRITSLGWVSLPYLEIENSIIEDLKVGSYLKDLSGQIGRLLILLSGSDTYSISEIWMKITEIEMMTEINLKHIEKSRNAD